MLDLLLSWLAKTIHCFSAVRTPVSHTPPGLLGFTWPRINAFALLMLHVCAEPQGMETTRFVMDLFLMTGCQAESRLRRRSYQKRNLKLSTFYMVSRHRLLALMTDDSCTNESLGKE
jgi:hypothetical protein